MCSLNVDETAKRTDPLLELPPNHVHVWLSFTHEARSDTLLCKYLLLLTDQEARQYTRFYFERDQHRYLVTRALVRTVLSRYLPIEPQQWRFKPDAFGRPVIINEHSSLASVEFNISHTEGLVALAVSAGHSVGIDVELLRAEVAVEIADRFFSKSEASSLRQLPPALQASRFLELWTLKESYAKARGMGLHIPFDQFGFEFPSDSRCSILFDTDFCDIQDDWTFWQLRVSPKHLAALCVHGLVAGSTKLVCRQVVPLSSETIVDIQIVRRS